MAVCQCKLSHACSVLAEACPDVANDVCESYTLHIANMTQPVVLLKQSCDPQIC